jgi:hypothetical protein
VFLPRVLEAQYPFLKEDQQVGNVLCSICKSQFSREHGGRSDTLQHIKKRKLAIAAETKSCSKKVTSYFTKEIQPMSVNILQQNKDCLHSTQ